MTFVIHARAGRPRPYNGINVNNTICNPNTGTIRLSIILK